MVTGTLGTPRALDALVHLGADGADAAPSSSSHPQSMDMGARSR